MGNSRTFVRYALALALAGSMGFLLIGAPGVSAAPTINPKVVTLSDQVRHKLVMLPWYGVFDNLEYQVNGTEVTLIGQVVSEHGNTQKDAERAVESIPGVTKVVNNIEVLPTSPMDGEIRRAVYRAIYGDPALSR